MLMLIRENNSKEEILLQKRQNTGYCDGYYDFSCSGHVEENETMTNAVCREAKEELKWFYINDLPNNLINDRIQAINNYQNKIKYSEYGWEK